MRMSKNNRKIFWGLLFILAAVYVIISRIWILPDISVLHILLTLLLVWIFLKGLKKVNFWQILFPIAFLCILYEKQLGITELTPWPVLGAALLGSIGFSLMIKKKSSHLKQKYDLNGECVCFENNFGESIKYIYSDNFVNGHFENNFGSMSVYFDNAMIQEETASAVVECNFGEIQLFIPKEWQVINELQQNLGGIQERGRCEGTSHCRLILKGEANFGEIVVHYI